MSSALEEFMQAAHLDPGIRAARVKIEDFFAELDVVRVSMYGELVKPPNFETEVRGYMGLITDEAERAGADEQLTGRALLLAATAMAMCRRLREERP